MSCWTLRNPKPWLMRMICVLHNCLFFPKILCLWSIILFFSTVPPSFCRNKFCKLRSNCVSFKEFELWNMLLLTLNMDAFFNRSPTTSESDVFPPFPPFSYCWIEFETIFPNVNDAIWENAWIFLQFLFSQGRVLDQLLLRFREWPLYWKPPIFSTSKILPKWWQWLGTVITLQKVCFGFSVWPVL